MGIARNNHLGKAVVEDECLHGRAGALGIGSFDFTSLPAVSEKIGLYHRLIADPMHNPYEIGVAFPKNKNGMKWFSVEIDSPLFPAPIHAALLPDRDNPNEYNLVWNRLDQQFIPELNASATTPSSPSRRYIGASATP